MSETYCGKDCQACACREEISCGGCQTQRQHCTIAQCCRDRWQQSCQTCHFVGECYKLRGKDSMPDYIRRQQQIAEAAQKREAARAAEAQRRREELVRRAPLMARWMSVMFWLTIASIAVGLVGKIPGLALISSVLTAVCGLGCAWALLCLQEEDGRYRTAAICLAIPTVISLVVALIGGGGEAPTWTLALSLPAGVVELVGQYNKCMAHGALVGAVDAALGDRWEKIWKWQIISIGSLLGSVVLALIIPVLGLLATLAAAIAVLVVSVLEMAALYRSAEAFRNFS